MNAYIVYPQKNGGHSPPYDFSFIGIEIDFFGSISFSYPNPISNRSLQALMIFSKDSNIRTCQIIILILFVLLVFFKFEKYLSPVRILMIPISPA